MVIHAIIRILNPQEWITSGAEDQAGRFVEPRGGSKTWDDDLDYRRSTLVLLVELIQDVDAAVAQRAQTALIASLRGMLEMPHFREHVIEVVASLPLSVVARVRLHCEHLRNLAERSENNVDLVQAINDLAVRLPAEGVGLRLEALLCSQADDWPSLHLAEEIATCVRKIDAADPLGVLSELLSSLRVDKLPQSVGDALSLLGAEFEAGVELLTNMPERSHEAAVEGFLWKLAQRDGAEAYDRCLDQVNLPPLLALKSTTYGARTEAAVQRIVRLVPLVEIVPAAEALAPWMHGASFDIIESILGDWIARITTQDEYNAVVCFVRVQLHDREDVSESLELAINELVDRRREFPKMVDDTYWLTLLRRQVREEPVKVVTLIMDLHASELTRVSSYSVKKLLREAVEHGGGTSWCLLMSRIEDGDWKLYVQTQEWLGNAASPETANEWVGGDLERARWLARVAKPGGTELSPVVRYLIEDYGDDSNVANSLAGNFSTGTVFGLEQEHIANQITEVEAWRQQPGQSEAVHVWLDSLVSNLRRQRQLALVREEERDW
jgi:hypothetical protein